MGRIGGGRGRTMAIARMAAVVALVWLAAACGPSGPWRPAAPTPTTEPAGAVITTTGVVAPVLSTFAGGWWVRTPCYRTAVVFSARPVGTVDVVIDPGHGGTEDGAVGADGIREKDINASIAKLVAADLRAGGLKVTLTHTRDDFLTLHTRGEIATAIAPRVFVSVHHNSGPTQPLDHPGTESIFQFRSARSKALAEVLFREVRAGIADLGTDWAGNPAAAPFFRMGDNGDYYGLLRHSGGVPAAIIEAGYISNPAEARLFIRPEYQRTESAAIARGIRSFLADEARIDRGPEPQDRPRPGEVPDDSEGCIDPPLE